MDSRRRWVVGGVALVIVLAAAIELAMGRVAWCRCGYVKLWHGVVLSSENSQHLTDWYTPSHVIHGLAFYGILWLVLRRSGPDARLLLAVVIESAWEVFENTSFVINRYREVTIALDYYGDSVLNSLSDIGAMMLGFAIARRAPVWASVSLAMVMEVGVAIAIRDNLALNILMLLYPLDVVKQWQGGS
ncbi:MAG: DUF2585 domain-containing protein [Acidobacteriota bacterium]